MHASPFRGLARGLLLGAAAIAGVAAAAVPDFTGVWQPVSPPLALRTSDGKEPPLKPAARKIYDARKAQIARKDFSFDPSSTKCAPPGEPRIMTETMPFDIFQTKDKLLFGYQWSRLLRYVELDKPLKVPSPYYFGTSVGRFEGDTLAVEADGFNDRFFLDRSGMPHSDQLKLKEWFRMTDGGKAMEVRIRFEDPATFTAPWETKLTFRRVPGGRIKEDLCPLRQNLVPRELLYFDPK